MKYNNIQIMGTAESARLSGFKVPSLDQSIAFLDWYFEVQVEIKSELEAIALGLPGTLPNGAEQQEAKWAELGLERARLREE